MEYFDFIEFEGGLKKRTCFSIESFCGRIEYAFDDKRHDGPFPFEPIGHGFMKWECCFDRLYKVSFRNGAISIGNGSYVQTIKKVMGDQEE